MPTVPVNMRRFGRYTLIYKFASGGMANLFVGRLAGSDGFERLVAIKVIHDHLTDDPEFSRMFIDEARLISRIYHPNVVQVLELGKVGQNYFIAMEYVEGESVAAILRRTKPNIRLCSRIVAHVAAGLHSAHELRGQNNELFHVVHRDVSPQNILVGYNGSTKVVDFGVARARGCMHTTKEGSLKGKFGYMAPEQVTQEPVDRRADIFALGIVLYEMTTCKRLFKAETDSETLSKVIDCSVPPPSMVVDGYPPELEQIVLKALRRDPRDRYQTALEMQDAIEGYIASSGLPVLQHHVAGMMWEVFSDRIEKKKRLLADFEEDPDASVPEAEVLSGLSDKLSEIEALDLRRRRLWLVGGVAGILVVALAVAMTVLVGTGLNKATAQPDHGAQAQHLATAAPATKPAPDEVLIAVSATPPDATIEVGGQRVPNPYRFSGPPGTGEAEVVISAAGYVTRRLMVDRSKGGRWIVELRKLPPEPALQDKKPRRNKRRRKRRKSLSDRDVLANPYDD
jgi:serine/threonine-protein kinase